MCDLHYVPDADFSCGVGGMVKRFKLGVAPPASAISRRDEGLRKWKARQEAKAAFVASVERGRGDPVVVDRSASDGRKVVLPLGQDRRKR